MRIKLLIFLSYILSFPQLVTACSCEISPIASAFQYSTNIVKGTILSKDEFALKDSMQIKPHYICKYLVAVSEVYKGENAIDTMIIYSDASEAACGFMFEVGKKYIIYSSGYEDILKSLRVQHPDEAKTEHWVSLCSRTKRFKIPEASQLKKLSRQALKSSHSDTDISILAQAADIVIKGKALSVEEIYNFTDKDVTSDGVKIQNLTIADKYTIRVSKIYKGQLPDSILTIYVKKPFPNRNDSCKLLFALNRKYLLLASKQTFFPDSSISYLETEQLRIENTKGKNVYYMNKCTGTRHFKRSEARKLKKIYPVAQ